MEDNICRNNIDNNPKNETIVIFGGSGSLGTTIIKKWISNNLIINVSRGEEKQYILQKTINNRNLSQEIGDISYIKDVENVLLKYKPTLIIIAACLKHIDICEKNPMKAISNNVNGIDNVKRVIDLMSVDIKPKTVLFVSTDKACAPITVYGYSKSLGESLIQSYSDDNSTKYICVRYGNVLNSSGSIIPFLQKVRRDPTMNFTITDTRMTRFLMTLDQSVNLIEYSIRNAKGGEIVVPILKSMRIIDLFSIFMENVDKTLINIGLRCKEKIHEDLISSTESENCYEDNTGYIHINIKRTFSGNNWAFDSSKAPITKEQLKEILVHNKLL
jgi:UDP-N-acetylglucosamine 4,6-dehydratase